MAVSLKAQVLDLIRARGVLRSSDLTELSIPRAILRRMVADGTLSNPVRGVYFMADSTPSIHQSLIEACMRVPRGVVCLLSALQFHGLTTQAPFEVWMAIGESARRPTAAQPPLRIVRFSGPALSEGVEQHEIDGVKVQVYSPAKTVADCFKYRNKIGIDVALEALRDCRRQRKATMDELYRAAEICRVARVIRPYLESVS